jgi:DNA-binding NtrC family response regulator
VLLIARDPGLRRALAAALAPDFRATGVESSALSAPAPYLDAAAAIACLDGQDDEAAVTALLPLLSLPLRASLLLSLHAARDEIVEFALSQLEPVQVLSQPAPAALLRYAVARALSSATPGRGARSQQRRAPALLGVSTAIRKVLEQVKQVAGSPIPVLIQGETGTGKELVARAIHEQSPRAGGPFVAINCGALPDSLLESELFGHRRGAFTGADRDKKGLFEEADGGTLFLDEIAELDPSMQRKLLRVLQEGEFRKVGGREPIKVDVRILSATNADVAQRLKDGSFREDLYFRLKVMSVRVPPLRERRGDVPALVDFFLEQAARETGRPRPDLADDALALLMNYSWPGNVRELKNEIFKLSALAEDRRDAKIDARMLRNLGEGTKPVHLSLAGRTLEELEKEAIRQALEAARGKRIEAARLLGLPRRTFYNRLKRYGLL